MFRSFEIHPNRTLGGELLVGDFRLRFETVLNAVHATDKFDMGGYALHISLMIARRAPTSIG